MTSSTSSRAQFITLTRTLASSEFKLRYSGSALGYFWSVSKPLILFAVLYVAFAKFMRVGQGIPFYPLQLLLGIVIWSFFSETTSGATRVLVARAEMIRKIAFPHIVLPLSISLTALYAMAFNLLAVGAFIFAADIPVTVWWLVFPLLLCQLYLFSVGVSLILSALFVSFRDIGQIWEVALQVIFYGTPIIYPLGLVPERLQPFMMANPLAQIVQQARTVLITGDQQGHLSDTLHGWSYVAPFAITLGTLTVGLLLYRALAPKIAERL
jgi:ABC-2 type transport system permease protein